MNGLVGFEDEPLRQQQHRRQFVIAADRRIEGFAIIANFAAESASVGLMVMGRGHRDYPQILTLYPGPLTLPPCMGRYWHCPTT